MTLVLGARCGDGVVMVGDRKITDTMGTFLGYKAKLAGLFRNIMFGYAGAVHMYKVFERCVAGDFIISRDLPDRYTSENILEKIASTMVMLLEARSNQPFNLTVLIGRQFPNNGKSDLHVVDSLGKVCSILDWKAIGKGDSLANPVVEYKWSRDMSMKEFANLSYCVIKYIEDRNLEQSVGGEPWVRYQKDGEDLDKEPEEDEIKEFQESTKAFKI
jgi:20S proteasome alpha/beta subunit